MSRSRVLVPGLEFFSGPLDDWLPPQVLSSLLLRCIVNLSFLFLHFSFYPSSENIPANVAVIWRFWTSFSDCVGTIFFSLTDPIEMEWAGNFTPAPCSLLPAPQHPRE